MTSKKVVILAAGRGSRLGSLTEYVPKALLQIGNSSCFESQIQIYESLDFNDINVITGFQRESFGQFSQIREIYNPHWEVSNMLTSLIMSFENGCSQINIISYGDIVFEKAAVAKLMASSHKISLLYDVNFLDYWNERTNDPISDLEELLMEPDGKIKRIGGKPTNLETIEGQYMGLLKITTEGWQEIKQFIDSRRIQAVNKLSITEFLSAFIQNGGFVYGIPFDGKWCEIDTERDLIIAREKFSKKI